MHMLRGLAVALAFVVAACSADPAPAPVPGASASAEAAAQVPVSGPERRIVAFGDSLFAAYGLEKSQGYPARLEAALRSQGLNVRVSDAGVSGDTTAAGRQRIAFALDQEPRKPDLVIVELGGNDMLRALPPAETKANLSAILGEVAKRDIPILLMGMRAPPNLGADYQAAFDAIYPALAEQYGAALVPFFLQATYDKPQLIQSDRVHPTAEGIEALVAATSADVAKALPPVD